MPIHDDNRMEYAITSGHIEIVTDDGDKVRAFWAHPSLGTKFSGIVLLHDWWGVNALTRTLSNFFAQVGYYVIVPDMFGGQTAQSPREALRLVEASQAKRYEVVDAALSVMESHHQINKSVAAIGVGMGGTLTLEAAIRRDDLEASVAYSGFPQTHLGEFSKANTPVLAFFGQDDPFISKTVVQSLQRELTQTELKDEHRVRVVPNMGHDLFVEGDDPLYERVSTYCINETLAFLEQYLEQPKHPPRQQAY